VGPRDTRETQFRDFVAARSAALLRIAYLVSGDVHLAEDLLQTTLARTYLAWRRLDGLDSLEAYSRRVLLNTATSWWRRRWRGERATLDVPERPVSDQAERVVERDAVWRLLRTLPARQRAVLVLRYYEDLSEAEIAAQLGLSTGTVKSHASRALAALRTQLAEEPDLRRRSGPPGPPGAQTPRIPLGPVRPAGSTTPPGPHGPMTLLTFGEAR
jgi:RNA polymerase sigma-70 factor (ECF subfamily)